MLRVADISTEGFQKNHRLSTALILVDYYSKSAKTEMVWSGANRYIPVDDERALTMTTMGKTANYQLHIKKLSVTY